LDNERYIEFKRLGCDVLTIRNLHNIGDSLVFFDLHIYGKIEIIDSMLGNTKFVNCNFEEVNKINITGSNLSEVNFINVNWGKISEERICPIFSLKKAKAKYISETRDLYRQLKLAHDNQKDYLTANQFYALEMRAYEKQLKEEGWTKDNWQDRIVFTLHKWISNFGLSYGRPLVGLLGLTAIMAYLKYGERKSFFLGQIVDLLHPDRILLAFSYMFLLIIILLSLVLSKEAIKKFKDLSNLEFTLTFIFLILSAGAFLNLSFQEKSPLLALDRMAETLNIAKVFGSNSTTQGHEFQGYKFLYTLYLIISATLIYQFILAIRRRVKR
jgi:hypothetical protein